jgi:hypothetical protein
MKLAVKGHGPRGSVMNDAESQLAVDFGSEPSSEEYDAVRASIETAAPAG